MAHHQADGVGSAWGTVRAAAVTAGAGPVMPLD